MSKKQSSGLEPALMTAAVTTAWILTGIPFIGYASAAAVTMSVTWYIQKHKG